MLKFVCFLSIPHSWRGSQPLPALSHVAPLGVVHGVRRKWVPLPASCTAGGVKHSKALTLPLWKNQGLRVSPGHCAMLLWGNVTMAGVKLFLLPLQSIKPQVVFALAVCWNFSAGPRTPTCILWSMDNCQTWCFFAGKMENCPAIPVTSPSKSSLKGNRNMN